MKKLDRYKISGETAPLKSTIHDIVDEWLDVMANGNYMLTLERKKSNRSISQNNLMWKWFEIIAEAWTDFGGPTYTRDNVHDYYCLQFLSCSLPNGKTIGGSTSKLTTEQMTEFLNKVGADAATEFGIRLPHPEDMEIGSRKDETKLPDEFWSAEMVQNEMRIAYEEME